MIQRAFDRDFLPLDTISSFNHPLISINHLYLTYWLLSLHASYSIKHIINYALTMGKPLDVHCRANSPLISCNVIHGCRSINWLHVIIILTTNIKNDSVTEVGQYWKTSSTKGIGFAYFLDFWTSEVGVKCPQRYS